MGAARDLSDSHFETFNVGLGILFNFYLSQFPVRQAIPYTHLERDFEPILELCETDMVVGSLEFSKGKRYIKNSNVPPRAYIDEMVAWLKSEGFLHEYPGRDSPSRFQLTSKALHALDAVPVGLDQPLRTKLASAVREAGSAAGRSAISDTVGQIIGAAARSLAGG